MACCESIVIHAPPTTIANTWHPSSDVYSTLLATSTINGETVYQASTDMINGGAALLYINTDTGRWTVGSSYSSPNDFAHLLCLDGTCTSADCPEDQITSSNKFQLWDPNPDTAGYKSIDISCSYPPSSPPPSASLPHSPLLAPAVSAGISGDPHLKGAHGEEADFKGEHNAVYNALSAKNLSFNIGIEHSNFWTPYSKLNVHGSWVKVAYHTVRTSGTGRQLQILFRAIEPQHAVINDICKAPHCTDTRPRNRSLVLGEGAPTFKSENVAVTLRHMTLILSNGQWQTSTQATTGAPHVGIHRLSIEVKPTYAVDYDPIAPHGVRSLEQSEMYFTNTLYLVTCV